MKKIDREGLKQIQMEVLDSVDCFCQTHNIHYSMSCGTLLGAIRHKGYIPWDDDIDIYLLREDYNKLISSFPEIYQEKYKIVSLERDNKWDRPYAKAYHSETVFMEATTSSYPLGVCIDIFPIDAVPDSIERWKRYNQRRIFYQYLYALKVVTCSSNRSWLKNIMLFVGRAILLPISTRKIAIHISKYAQKHNKSHSQLVFENVLGMMAGSPFRKDLFDSLVDTPFENRVYKAFANADSYLTATYGNWRKLPPEEKQVTHHAFKAYWKD